MSVKVIHDGTVKKSFVSQHKKELLLLAAAAGAVALGIFVSPDIGVGFAGIAAFLYGAPKLLCPGPRKLTRQEIEDIDDFWEVKLEEPTSTPAERRKSVVVTAAAPVVRPNFNDDPDVIAMFAAYDAENGIRPRTVATTPAPDKRTEAKAIATPARVTNVTAGPCWLEA